MKSRAWTALVLFLCRSSSIAANILSADLLSSCADSNAASAEPCLSPLENITVVESGEFVVAKLQCYGCSTVAALEKGYHSITHEENALFFNISLSHNRTQLLLNSEPFFPPISASSAPKLYAPQIPLNFSLSSLASAIECTQQPCRNFDGKCNCIADNLGGMGLSYDYYAFSSSASGGWIIRLDALGGHNGYMADPYEEFVSPQQRVLQIDIEQHQNGQLEILDSTRLVERVQLPAEDGHVVHLLPDWDSYGRTGTFRHFLHKLWAVFLPYPLGLIVVIVFSTLAGLALLYGTFRFVKLVRLVYRSLPKGESSTIVEDKWDERGVLLDDDEEKLSIELEDFDIEDQFSDSEGASHLLDPNR